MSAHVYQNLELFVSLEPEAVPAPDTLSTAEKELLEDALCNVQSTKGRFDEQMASANKQLVLTLTLLDASVSVVEEARKGIEQACENPAVMKTLAAFTVEKAEVEAPDRAEAVELLTSELHRHMQVLARELGLRAGSQREEILAKDRAGDDGMLWLDRVAAGVLKDVGSLGAKMSTRVVKEALVRWGVYVAATGGLAHLEAEHALWRMWVRPDDKYPANRIQRVLATVVLHDVVLSRLEAQAKTSPLKQETDVVTLSVAVCKDLREVLCRDNEVQTRDGIVVMVDSQGHEVAAVTVPLVEVPMSIIERGGQLLGSITGQTLIRYLVIEAFRLHQEKLNDVDQFIDGGISELAERIGGANRLEVTAILAAGHYFHRTWARGNKLYGLWTYGLSERKSRTGHPHRLVITPSHCLRPYFAEENLPLGQRFGRPILPMPVKVGDYRNEWAAQALFQDELTLEMVRSRLELYEKGGICLDEATLARLADNAGLHGDKPWEPLLDCWSHDGDTAPAMLVVQDGRYSLSDHEPYKAAREWLLRGGEKSTKGRANQKARRFWSKKYKKGKKP